MKKAVGSAAKTQVYIDYFFVFYPPSTCYLVDTDKLYFNSELK
jgi:hypothetical protein